jgi:hypothetical protein
MSKSEHAHHAEIRERIEALARTAEIASGPDEPIDELINRIRLGLDEQLLEFEHDISNKQSELDDLAVEYEDTLALDAGKADHPEGQIS